MGLKPEQDIDINGDKSNSHTRREARQKLEEGKNLTKEEQKYLPNRTKVRYGRTIKMQYKMRLANKVRLGESEDMSFVICLKER